MAEGVKRFYDHLASNYHLIFEDWDASMKRQAAALGAILERECGAPNAAFYSDQGSRRIVHQVTAESGFYQPIVLAKANSTL